MDNININNLITGAGLVITAVTALTGVVFYFVNSEKRKYGLERDLLHLKRTYEQLNINLKIMSSEQDRRFDDVDKILIELKSFINNKI